MPYEDLMEYPRKGAGAYKAYNPINDGTPRVKQLRIDGYSLLRQTDNNDHVNSDALND